MDLQKPSLFLHMGPGLHAEVEKKLLSKKWSHTYFWNQPSIHVAENAFNQLVNSATQKLTELQTEIGQPIQIIAHSFGGHIANKLIQNNSSKISDCIFFNCGYDIPNGFFRLLKVIAQSSITAPDLKKEINSYLKTKSKSAKEDIWSYIGLISKDPNFNSYYWVDKNKYNRYIELVSKTSALDMLSFQYILNDFLQNHLNLDMIQATNWKGKVEFHFGEKDPLIDLEHEMSIWTKIYPLAKIQTYPESGHFQHLESI